MRTLRSTRVAAVLLCGVFTGCSGNVSRGHTLYSEGYYVEAAEVFERNERRLSEWPPQKKATYGLYRGMTLMQLGDLQGAARWFAYARWIANEHPGALPPHEFALLGRGQQTLDYRMGRSQLESPSPVMATTSSTTPPPPDSASTPGAREQPKVRRSFAE